MMLVFPTSGCRQEYGFSQAIQLQDFSSWIILSIKIQMQGESYGWFEWLGYKTWFPFKTLKSIVIASIVLGAVFFIVAIILFIIFANTYNYETLYASNGVCKGTFSNNTCQMTISVPQTLHPPVLVLYTLGNAYINHARYINSISQLQLDGTAISMSQTKASCTPFVTNQEMQKNISYTGVPLSPAAIAYPCGFKPYLTFNDTYKLISSNGTQVAINQSNLDPLNAVLFNSRPNSSAQQWISVNNQHFQQWVKNQAMINKYKLWGRIDQTVPAGNYSLVVNDIYHIGALKLEKSFSLVKPSNIGGPVYFYPITFCVMGAMCIIYAIYLKVTLNDYDQKVAEAEQQ